MVFRVCLMCYPYALKFWGCVKYHIMKCHINMTLLLNNENCSSGLLYFLFILDTVLNTFNG